MHHRAFIHCVLCVEMAVPMNHLFSQWCKVLSLFGICWVRQAEVEKVILSSGLGTSQPGGNFLWKMNFQAVFWSVCKERNECVFSKEEALVEDTFVLTIIRMAR